MPGAWICDKCGFQLQKNILYTGDGAIGADTSPINNVCPNDGILMRPLTWREVNEGLFDQVMRLMDENALLRAELDRVKNYVDVPSPLSSNPNFQTGALL